MANQREKPDFIVDPSGNAKDVRHLRYTDSQPSSSDKPPRADRVNQANRFSQKPKKSFYLIPIPIGLIIYILVSLLQRSNPPNTDVNTFNSEGTYNAFRSGNYSFFRGEYDEAIMHYNMVIRSDSDNGDVYNGRGLAYQAKGVHNSAIADFDHALQLMPNSAMVYNNRALSYYAINNYEQAIADLNKAIEIQSNLGKAYYNRGITYYAMGNYEQAIADLSKAIELSSNWGASPLDQTSDPESNLLEGLSAQLEAMQSYTDLPSAYHGRGLAYFANGENESAISDLNEAINLQPDFTMAYYTRAAVYLSDNNDEAAKADCDTALELENNSEVQLWGEEVQYLCDLLLSGYDAPSDSNLILPTKVASDIPILPTKITSDIPTEEPPISMAIYISQPNETPTTAIWENTQVSCDEKPFNMWGSPGIYLYKRNASAFLSVTLKPGEAGPSFRITGPPVGVSLSLAGTDSVTTDLGTFQATLLSGEQGYSLLTGRLDSLRGTYKRSEWYVCGLGLVKLTTSDIGIKTPGDSSYSIGQDITLMSFTPPSTNETHVRYILVDMQLANIVDEYIADITDEETAEAVRRWNADVRVENIEEFARKIVNEQWLIVYAGTENPINGNDVTLTSDSPQ